MCVCVCVCVLVSCSLFQQEMIIIIKIYTGACEDLAVEKKMEKKMSQALLAFTDGSMAAVTQTGLCCIACAYGGKMVTDTAVFSRHADRFVLYRVHMAVKW